MAAPPTVTAPRERLVLNFHGVGEVPAHVQEDERPYWLTRREFLDLLDAVRPTAAASGVELVLTFDDGNDSDARIVLRALRERGLVASFFVCAGRIGQPGYLDEAQIRALRDAGMGVGSHGWGHVDWRTADDAQLDRELRVARDRLSGILGTKVDEAAVPFGSYDRRVIRALKSHGYRLAYTSDRGRAPNGWIVPRETWVSGWGRARLQQLADDHPSTIQHASRRLIRLVKRLR